MKNIIKNVILSFFSYAFPTVVLQFFIQPLIAFKLGSELNGKYLTIMSLNYFMIGITATVLNTVRLLENKQYEKEKLQGDFNIIYIIYMIILSIVIPIGYILYSGEIDVLNIILTTIISFLYLYHDYIFAQYRIRLQYNKILINNCLLVIGFLIGSIIFIKMSYWQFIYIIPYLLGGVYDYINTDFIKEPVRKTKFFKNTAKKVIVLTSSNALSSATTYFDKLVIYPFLGGTSVSVYNSAAIIGKILILISSPLNSVLLSYLIKFDSINLKLKKKMTWIIFCIVIIFIIYIAFVQFGYIVTDLLYPKWAEKSKIYIPITVLAGILKFFSSLLNTVIIRFYNLINQIYIQSVNLIIYLLVSFIGLKIAGLMGFCIGYLISNIIQLAMEISIFYSKRK